MQNLNVFVYIAISLFRNGIQTTKRFNFMGNRKNNDNPTHKKVGHRSAKVEI